MAKATAEKSQTLVVVESPTKAKTLKKYLGPGFEVMASRGHVKDLPKKLGIDVEQDFAETYQVIEGKEKLLSEMKGAAQQSDVIYLATDPDREGEAIAVHIADELSFSEKPIRRVLFHEITKRGVTDGIANPVDINLNLYEAQRSRRVLDRLVGYDVSALVWSKLAFGLSAGRVQSVALRLVVDREREIQAFVPEEYWNIGAHLKGDHKLGFVTRLMSANGKKLPVGDGDTAAKVKADLASANYSIAKVTKRVQKRNAPAPFTTSKLQQDATTHLRFTAKRTMQIAQKLYEGIDLGKKLGGHMGLITYMRTDSTRVSDDAVKAVRDEISERYGEKFLPKTPNKFKSKKNSQDAHEAIRPASLEFPPEKIRAKLSDEQFKLYKLIWDRFVASQMSPALYDQTAFDVEAIPGRDDAFKQKYILRANGRILKFAGWLEQYGKGNDREFAGEAEGDAKGDAKVDTPSLEKSSKDTLLPPLSEGDGVKLDDPPGVLAEQKFTQPPPRFNEGSLVRELEKRGIGRPSTYAEIISKVQARSYVAKLPSGAFQPSELGMIVVDGLVGSNLDFMDPGFTAKLEEQLDEVEAGKKKRVAVLTAFYERFRTQLDESKKQKRWNPEPVDMGITCESCNVGSMQKRWSKNGWFAGCSNYPKCKNTRNLTEDGELAEIPPAVLTSVDCEECDAKMQLKTGRFGKFLGCSNYPKCNFTRPIPLGIDCPSCADGNIIEIKSKKRGSRTFWGCSNYNAKDKCEFKLWKRPIAEPCPNCNAKFLVMMGTKKAPSIGCQAEGCGYKEKITPEVAEQKSQVKIPDWVLPLQSKRLLREAEERERKRLEAKAKKAAEAEAPVVGKSANLFQSRRRRALTSFYK